MANNEINQVVVNGNTYKLVGQDINLAPIEADASSASKSYAIGDHLVVESTYCKAIAAISAGDALVKGTNIQSVKVGDEIKENSAAIVQLNASLSDKGTARQFVVEISASSGVEIGRWIKNNISIDILQKGLTFNFIPTLSPSWWSGQMFSDGGSTWWGYYMNRDTNILYKYVYAGGADSVTPFKGGHGTKSITANGTFDVTDYASVIVNVKNPSIFYKFSGPHSVAGYWTTTQVTIDFSDVVSAITSIKEIRLVNNSSYISYTNLTFSGTTVSLTLKNAADAAFSATVFVSINGIPK